MTLQPIYDEHGQIIDHYDDGSPDNPPEGQVTSQPPEEAIKGDERPSWTIPEPLKGVDLFLGITIHRDEGHPQGPLVSMFARELPEGRVHVEAFRAADLSEGAFLDELQKGVVATMQKHFLARAEQQRKKLEEEAKRKTRMAAQSASKPSPAAPIPAAKQPATTASAPAVSTQTPPPTPKKQIAPTKHPGAKKTEQRQPEKKYATISMFD